MGQSVPMIASARQVYMGQSLRSGDKFDAASESDAADLVAVNMARRDLSVATKPEQKPQAVTRETTADTAPQSDGNLQRGRYGRRDVQARR